MKKIIILFFPLFLFINCKSEPQHLVKIEGKLIPITEEISSKKSIEVFVQPYKEKVEKEMNMVLSFTSKDLVRTDGELESTLGNLMADMCYEKANEVFVSKFGKNIDFSMFNYGGIRAGIPKGEITFENAFKLMPFENSLVVVELTAEKVKALADYLVSQNKAHPLSKHVNLVVSTNKYELKIHNKPLDNSKTYFIATSDYLQNGGDNMTFFKDPVNLFKLDYKVRDAIIDYLNETDEVGVELDGRFRKENY